MREKVSVPMWIFPYMLLQWWRRRQRRQQLEQLTFHGERQISFRNIRHRLRGHFAAAAGKSAVGFLGRSSLPPTPLSSMSILLEGSHYFHYMKHFRKINELKEEALSNEPHLEGADRKNLLIDDFSAGYEWGYQTFNVFRWKGIWTSVLLFLSQ